MPVYDDEEQKSDISSDDLNRITGIDPQEEKDTEDRAYSGAADDIASREGLDNADEAPNSGPKPTKPDSNEKSAVIPEDQVGSGFTDDGGKKTRRKFWTRRKTIGGGIIGVLVGGGLGLSIITGPLQFLHLDAALSKPSKIGSLIAEARLYGFTRAARAYKTGDIGETRVGYWGSRNFNKLLDRLESQHGIRIDRRIATGRPHNARVVPPEGSPLRGATRAETEANIRKHLALPEDASIQMFQEADGSYGARFFLRASTAKNLDRLVRSMVSLDNQTANITRGELHLAMRKRFLKKAWGAPSLFSPLSKASYTLDQNIRTILEKRQAERDRKNRTGKRAQLRAKYRSAISQARNKIGASNLTRAGAALAFTGGLCTLKEMSGLLPALNYAAIAVPAMEETVDKQAVASQMRAGQGFFNRQLGGVAETFSDEDGRTIWSSKPLNALSRGGAGDGIDADPSLKQAFGMQGSNISSLVDLLVAESDDTTLIEAAAVGGDAFADIACSPGGYAIQIVAGGALTLLAPGGAVLKTAQFLQSSTMIAAVTYLFADLIEEQVEGAARGLCGQDEEGRTVDAAAFGSCMAYGARAVHNVNAASMGGVALSESEEIDMMIGLEELEYAEFSKKGLAPRLFDQSEPRSLAANVLSKSDPGSLYNTIASITFSTPVTHMGSIVSSFMKRTYAVTENYDWGFPLIGVPLHIIEDPKYEDPFENAQKFADIYSSGNVDTERARTCFGVNFTKVDGRLAAVIAEEVVPMENEYVKAACNDLSEENWVRTMLFVFDDALVTSIDCYEGGELACREIGFGSISTTAPTSQGQIVGDPYTDGLDVACAEGSNDIGTTTGYVNGRSFNIRLCSLPNLPSSGQADNPGGQFSTPGADGYAIVNSRVSGAWLNLVNDAKAASISLQATSTFRSMNHQSHLCNNDPGCRNGDYSLVARPGYSSHQAGVAIDFANGMGGVTGGKTCGSRARAPNSKAWVWLVNNAESYGFKQYAQEAWHWDALNSSNRCGSI